MAAQLTFDKLETPGGIGKFNGFLATKSYLQGYTPSKLDAHWFSEVSKCYGNGPEAKYAHARRWFHHINSYPEDERHNWGEPEHEPEVKKTPAAKEPKKAPAKKEAAKHTAEVKEEKKEEKKDEVDDLFAEPEKKPQTEVDDLFAESSEEPAAQPVAQPKPKVEAGKPKAVRIEKSNVIFDVKPIEKETDMALMEVKVRAIEMDGLFWGPSKLVEIAYGIMKLQITCVVEDEKVMMDDLEEKIMAFEELVQSVDVASMVRAG